jgi:hypothetical protein
MIRRLVVTVVLCAVACALGAAATLYYARFGRPRLPDSPALVVQMRDVARLETLDVTLYKKVSFDPDPEPSATLLGDALTWAKFTLRPPSGRAIVFADVHLGLDFSQLDVDHVSVRGDVVEIVLPPIRAQVELRPGETEVIGSNLDSQQTAQLLQVAKEAFEREALKDERLKARARASAERSIKGLVLSLGFREVRFVEVVPFRSQAG